MRKNILFIAVSLIGTVFLLCEVSAYAQQRGARGRSGGQQQVNRGRDRDNNPPGRVGGRGTNWENKPGAQGGPGASPDRRPAQAVDQRRERRADANKDGVVDQTEAKQMRSQVNTGWEKRSDTNQDGVVDETEAKQWKSQVNKRWEKRADTNQDGVVDQTEAQQWKERSRNNPAGTDSGQDESSE
jgi:hypothetical protein